MTANHFASPLLIVAMTAIAIPAGAQSGAGPQRNPYETCIAAEAAKAGGGMVAEAKARRACRERYPDQAVESNRRPAIDPAAIATGPAGTASIAAGTGATGSSSGASPSSPTGTGAAPAPTFASPASPAAPPGLSAGNPHGGPPGQAKK